MEKEISRYEFKYPIAEKMLPSMRDILTNYGMKPDPGPTANADGAYIVTSLYFDSPERADYYDKTGGFLDRKKLRVRIYEPHLHDRTNPIFLEKKIKHDMTVRKIRTPITLEEYNELIAGNMTNLLCRASGDPIQNEIIRTIQRENARPYLVVRYMREPFISATRPHFRLTLDTQLATCRSSDLRYNRGMQNVAPGNAVIELKYAAFLPTWFGKILADFELSRKAFSKYALSVETVNKYYPLPR